MTITIPIASEDMSVSNMRVAKCVVAADTTADTNQYDVIIGSGDSAAVLSLFQFQHDSYVFDVGWRIVTPFTASLTLTIGDSDDADGWSNAAANVGATVTDTEINWSRGVWGGLTVGPGDSDIAADTTSAPAYAQHGRTMIADTVGAPLNLTATVGGAVPATGVLEVYAMYMLMGSQKNTLST